MSKYLKLFDTHAEYESAQSSLILPNVSVCKDQPTVVHYNPYVAPPTPTYETVDLGLPSGTLWANMNVGATGITDYGNYYQYGKGAAQYAATSGDSDYSGTENPLATSADTAAQVMGGQWHIPTRAQLEELKQNTSYEFITINGVAGGKFTAQNGNYIFIPAAGRYYDGSIDFINEDGYMWSSTPEGSNIGSAELFNFFDGYSNPDSDSRCCGCSVRGVIG